MSQEIREHLLDKLHRLFDDVSYPGDDQIIMPEYSFISDGSRLFTGVQWQAVLTDYVECYATYISFLTPQGFHYFFPAFMAAILNYPGDVNTLLHNFNFNLTPPAGRRSDQIDWFDQRMKLFTYAERELIAEYFENYRDLFTEDEWFWIDTRFDDDTLQRAIQFWRFVSE